jgi:hypothetical protein
MSRDPQLDDVTDQVDGATVVFETGQAYIAGSTQVYINGVLNQRDSLEDGLIELGGKQVQLRYLPRIGDTVHLYYWTGESTAHPFPIPPQAVASIVLEPEGVSAIDLVPVPDSVEEQGVTETPQSAGTVDLIPEGVAVVDLVPVPLSVEEV